MTISGAHRIQKRPPKTEAAVWRPASRPGSSPFAGLPVERTYRDASGLILMCMYCRRTRRVGASDQWDWVEAYALQMPARVTHGICKKCLKAALTRAAVSGRQPQIGNAA
jgi:hypothetical protein